MKNMMRLLTGVLLAITLLSSCKKDDDKKETRNFLKVGDTEYDLSGGMLENYGMDDNNIWHYGYNTDIILYSKGLVLQTEQDDWELVGMGHGLYFEMFSTAGNSLDTKEYTYCSDEPCPIGTFDEGGYIINFDSETENSDDEDDIDSGKVSVSKNGNEYSITFDCTSERGEKITGFYKGTLRYFDWSGKKMSAGISSTNTKAKLLKN